MVKYDIFISYRREGGYDTAKHLYDLLIKDGYNVSFDIDTLRNGDFDTSLLKRIDDCKDFILIVDAHAFDRTLDPNFNPENDWLRQELAYALKKEKNIVPIFLNGIQGFPTNLPNDIVGVTKKNGPEYNRYYFNDFYKVLKNRFLSTKEGNRVGIIALITITICSIACLCYSVPREGEATNLFVTIYAILWAITLIALIGGISNPKFVFLNNRGYVSWYTLPFILSMGALGCGVNSENTYNQNQNYTPYLTAKQMNIYWGNPKSIISKNSNGFKIKSLFDEQGRITSVSYNDVKIVYNWKNNNKVILLSYNKDEFSGSNPIEILEFSKLKYEYNVGGAIDISVDFKLNGAIHETSITNPESIFKTIYEYKSESDMYPVNVIQEMDNQVINVKVSIDQFDDRGNPIRFTEKFLGNTIETNQIIEYY